MKTVFNAAGIFTWLVLTVALLAFFSHVLVHVWVWAWGIL